MDDFNIKAILEKLDVFEKTYESIRIVDPLNKKILTNNKDDSAVEKLNCFDFWGKNKVCDNCVSIRAYNENNTYVKFEYNSDAIFMVTAIPYEVEDRRVVIELLKDATDSLIFDKAEGQSEDKSEIYSLIDNLNKLALKDTLTGLYNRRYINEKLPVDLINTMLSEQNLSVVIADIDFFKKVNDIYGHLAGDRVLKIFVDTLKGCLSRTSDWIGRFGGEEFLICLPGADLEISLKTIESMRKTIEEKDIIFEGSKIKITASFGIYSLIPNSTDSIDDLIQKADEKLYLAKKNGRNRIEY